MTGCVRGVCSEKRKHPSGKPRAFVTRQMLISGRADTKSGLVWNLEFEIPDLRFGCGCRPRYELCESSSRWRTQVSSVAGRGG